MCTLNIPYKNSTMKLPIMLLSITKVWFNISLIFNYTRKEINGNSYRNMYIYKKTWYITYSCKRCLCSWYKKKKCYFFYFAYNVNIFLLNWLIVLNIINKFRDFYYHFILTKISRHLPLLFSSAIQGQVYMWLYELKKHQLI